MEKIDQKNTHTHVVQKITANHKTNRHVNDFSALQYGKIQEFGFSEILPEICILLILFLGPAIPKHRVPHPVLYPDFYQGARLSVTVVLSVTLAVVNLIFIEIDG